MTARKIITPEREKELRDPNWCQHTPGVVHALLDSHEELRAQLATARDALEHIAKHADLVCDVCNRADKTARTALAKLDGGAS